MEFTIVNGSNQKLLLKFHPVPYIPNPKKPLLEYEILPLDFCKVGLSSNEDNLFTVMGKKSLIEFEVLNSDKRIHVTHASGFSYKLDSARRKIQLDIK